MLASLLLSAGLLLAPAAQAASDVAQWDFAARGLEGWQLTEEMQLQREQDGLIVHASQDTVMLWTLPARAAADGMLLTALADGNTPVMLVWHQAGAAENAFQQFPVTLDGDKEELAVGLSDLPGFPASIDRFGFKLPAGATVLFKSLALTRTGGGEKLGLWWRSFWNADAISMRSINFLWGPRLASSQATLETMYQTEPAGGWTANWLFYGIALFGLGIGGWLRWNGRGALGAAVILWSLGGAWLLYDVRMSYELLHNAAVEHAQWVAAPAEERTLRDSDDAFRVLEALPALLEPGAPYALLSTEGFSPNFFRYATYPALPVTASGAQAGLRDWVVFHRPDITVGSGGLIGKTGPLTPPGEIVQRFSPHSFLFRVSQ
jgi:hypothetical protein